MLTNCNILGLGYAKLVINYKQLIIKDNIVKLVWSKMCVVFRGRKIITAVLMNLQEQTKGRNLRMYVHIITKVNNIFI